MNNSKKIILSLAFLALVNIISAQNFYEKTILPPNRIIGQGAIGAMSDFDNDGDMDMLFGGATNQNGIKFHLNNGTTFDSSFFMPIGNLSYFKISDIDVDGDDDIIAWNQGFIAIENLGNFNTSSTNLNIVGASSPMWIEMADMDGDGLEDIVFAQFSGRSIRWSKNLGALSFDTARTLINSQWGTRQITSFRVTDLDNDNDLDIVVRTNRSISQQLFICTDTGSYNYSINQIALSVFTYAIEDFNGDSLKDIAFTSSGNSSRILFNDSNSTFSQSTILRTSPRTGLLDVIESGVYAIDYDQDNDYDLFLCETRNQSQGIGKLYLNNNGSFTATDTTISGGIFNHIGGSKNLRELFYHDFDNDGDIDIVTKTNADGKVQYHEQINGNFNSTNYLDPGRMLMNDIQIIDVNNDGHEDLIANGVNNATNGGTSLAILLDNSGNYIDDYVLHDNVPGVLQDKYFVDINNDGKLDVIYATYNNLVLAYGTSNPGEYLITDSLNVTLYTSNPNSWTQGGIGLMNNSDEAMQVLDIDNDGDLDIVLIDRTPRILLFENQGNNTFQQRLLSASTISAYEMGDLDGDGDIDLVFGNFISSNQSDVRSWLFDHTTKQIVLNQRDTVNANLASPSFDLVDADTDGDLDIVYGGLNWQENTNGLGAFADDTLLISSPSATPLQINSGDFNNDGLIDLFHSVTSPPSIRVITNQGTSYSATDILATAPSSSNTNANSVYDLDNDGIDDIIYTSIDGYYQPYWLKVCFTQFDTNNVSACKSYTWIDGNTYNSSVSGINYTATNSLGCDTVFTLNLTIDTVDTRVSRSGITLTALNTSLIGANFQWVDCNNNFAPINGATSNTFTPNGNGSYAVAISDPNNSICSDTSSCFLVNSVGNRESHQLKNVTIYPNPSLSGLVQIEIGDLHKNLNYKVVNSIGQIVDSEIIVEQSTQIELPKETGLYHIEIFNQEGLRNTYKIIRR